MLQEEIEAFLEYKKKSGLSRNTEAAYRTDLLQFLQFAEDMGCAQADEISGSMLSYFLESRRRGGASEKTLARQISCLRGFYRYLIHEGLAADNPADEVSAGQESAPLRILTEREIERLHHYYCSPCTLEPESHN